MPIPYLRSHTTQNPAARRGARHQAVSKMPRFSLTECTLQGPRTPFVIACSSCVVSPQLEGTYLPDSLAQ